VADVAWITYHPFFPIARVTTAGDVTTWETELPPIDALAIAGDRVVAFARPRHEPSRCFTGRLDNGRLADVMDMATEPATLRHVVGRDSKLYGIDDDAIYVLDVDDT
jgi:hypothetical protein